VSGSIDPFGILSPFKQIQLYRHERKTRLRKMILEVQDVIRNLMEFRIDNKENRFLEFLIRNTARIQSRLVSKYSRRYGEFPLAIVEVEE